VKPMIDSKMAQMRAPSLVHAKTGKTYGRTIIIHRTFKMRIKGDANDGAGFEGGRTTIYIYPASVATRNQRAVIAEGARH